MQDPNSRDFHVVGKRPAHEERVAHGGYLHDAAVLVAVGIDAFAEVDSRRIQLLRPCLRGRPVGGGGGPSKGETERHGDYQGSHHHSSSGRVTAKNGPRVVHVPVPAQLSEATRRRRVLTCSQICSCSSRDSLSSSLRL